MAYGAVHRYGALMRSRLVAILTVLIAAIAVVLFGVTQSSTGTAPPASTPKTGTHPITKVTICHATGSRSHPYVEIDTPAFQFVFGVGHGGHTYDIWPSFLFKVNGHVVVVPAHGDQSILRNHCRIPGEDPEPCPTVTVTATATVTVTANPDKKTNPTAPPCSPTPTATTTVTSTQTVTPNPTETVTATTTATATVTGPTSTVTVTTPFVPSTGCPPPNLVNVVRGTRRGDSLVGTPCRDGMPGHGGNDLIFGAANNDVLFGQRGNDRLEGGTGRDVLRGGFGNDRLIGTDGEVDLLIGGVGRDVCIADAVDRTRNCERVVR